METASASCSAAAAVLDFFLGVPLAVALLGASFASCKPRRVKIARSKAAHVALAPSILFAASFSAYSLQDASSPSSTSEYQVCQGQSNAWLYWSVLLQW